MTAPILRTASVLLLAGTMFLAPAAAFAQEASPAPGAGAQSEPQWPAGVESWNSGERDPENVNPDEARKRGLTAPEVQKSLPPPPDEQGTRPPAPLFGPDEREQLSLYEMLRLARNAPAGLDGERIPRPNPYGSEPTTEMEPVGGPDHLFPEGYVE